MGNSALLLVANVRIPKILVKKMQPFGLFQRIIL